ncbi:MULTISPECIES: class I lanthipeptide [Flavobacterium]|uniref:class I lanthipeptide n=1 Tax=Flavobacterium TaxID=237 RepID=UPI0015B18C7A|nr:MULTISPECIES: class I lanthipeptide [Flavobacterium]MBN9283330.1 class I lanthipeptide [Flavobacterium sp.]
MKTTKNSDKLAFAKNAVVELNDRQLDSINGGSWNSIVNYIGDKLKEMMQPQV